MELPSAMCIIYDAIRFCPSKCAKYKRRRLGGSESDPEELITYNTPILYETVYYASWLLSTLYQNIFDLINILWED